MDPATVIVLLSLHLLATGGLLHLIGRRLPARGGLGAFAAGAALFGLAYGARLLVGLGVTTAASALSDAAMVAALLVFAGGMRQFSGREAWPLRPLAALTVVFLGADLAVIANAEPLLRYVLLNGALALLYATLASVIVAEARRAEAALRPPMRLLAALVAGLAALTAGRTASIARQGMAALYHGAYAQLFYVYASLVALLLGPCLLWMVFVRLNGQLEVLATHDALTRLLNRNGLDEVLRRHFGTRRREPLRLLLVDLDHFKEVNDRHGHSAGDRVLHAVAETLMAHVRGSDFVARTGGEEFLVGGVGGTDATAQALAERLRDAVQALAVALPGQAEPVRCTASIGISRKVDEAARWDEALREADTALYRAKAGGRNQVLAFAAD